MTLALDVVTTEVVAIMDVDTVPSKECLGRLVATQLSTGADCVQGTVEIPDPHGDSESSLLWRMAQLDYAGRHLGQYRFRSEALDAVYFLGSNAVWRTETLRSLKFSETSVVEDAEISLRAAALGFRLALETTAIAYETPPPGWRHWLAQRRRWEGGWHQLATSAATFRQVLALPPAQRRMWVPLLYGNVLLGPGAVLLLSGLSLVDKKARRIGSVVLACRVVQAAALGALFSRTYRPAGDPLADSLAWIPYAAARAFTESRSVVEGRFAVPWTVTPRDAGSVLSLPGRD